MVDPQGKRSVARVGGVEKRARRAHVRGVAFDDLLGLGAFRDLTVHRDLPHHVVQRQGRSSMQSPHLRPGLQPVLAFQGLLLTDLEAGFGVVRRHHP
jgi:hypothetical protein